MSCSGNSCSHHAQALKFISQARPKHLVLWGSCCTVRGLLGAAPRVTVLGTEVQKLTDLSIDQEQNRVRAIATSAPSLSLSSDPADVVYLCGSFSALTVQDFVELAAIIRPGGFLLLSARYSQGDLPLGEWPEVQDLAHWVNLLQEAGFSRVESLAEQVLIFSCQEDGELVYSVSDGLVKATKEE